MYEIKKQIYLDLSKNQKSALCNYLRALVKKSAGLSTDEIWNSFYADEKYYLELNCSRFEFLEQMLDQDSFYSDTLKYIKECQKYYIEKIELTSKLEARNEIDKIITEHAPKQYDYIEDDE